MSLRDESKENEELFEAVWDGDAYLIEDLIEAGADPDAVDGDMEYYYGQTPLTIATDHNDFECAEALLENGADVNMPDGRGTCPLKNAIERQNMKMIKLLLEHGADVLMCNDNGQTAVDVAEYDGDMELIAFLTPLVEKAERARLRKILESGNVDQRLNASRETLLMKACESGNTELVRQLLDAGADPNLSGRFGENPLDNAIYEGYTEIVRLLIEHGVRVTRHPKRRSPHLYYAVRYGRLEICKLLIEAGANPTLRVSSGGRVVTYPELARSEQHDKVAAYLDRVIANYR